MEAKKKSKESKVLSLLSKVLNRPEFNPSHIAVYTAILKEFLIQDVKDGIRITRGRIMRMAQIRSIATYHHCIKGLIKANLIQYHPSFHPKLGTMVKLL
ncbi:hypothetical protein [Arthrospiribacter ruber]|uniref:Uncharacterized protein n=1 Tax=Arthrospiribacter ruber TaxID=2487934 RepID=A0A951IST4_9BACT|nr:hypothetical protein [Arthrospiribacter ruber]MBW3467060.1 hypothetical protein [Arthrospiribacter ruber]